MKMKPNINQNKGGLIFRFLSRSLRVVRRRSTSSSVSHLRSNLSIAASIQTRVVLLERYIFNRSDFFGAFLSIITRISMTGLFSLGMRSVRVSLLTSSPGLKPWHCSKATEVAAGSTPRMNAGACAPLFGQRLTQD